MSDYPRETVEFLPFTVKVDGVETQTGIEVAVVAAGLRPMVWVSPTVLGGRLGVMVVGLAPGSWQVWAKVTSAPETPVISVGTFNVS